MIYFSLLSMTVWYIQAIFHLNPRWWCACFLWVLLLIPSKARSELDGPRSQDKPTYTAIVNITYKDSKTGESKSEKINGCYGMNSLIEPETGIVVHVRSGPPDSPTRNDACYPYFDNVIPSERWVALIERGECPFSEKIKNAAKKYNASAVVIYNNHSGEEEDKDVINMQHEAMDVVAIFIGHASGMRIASLLEEGTRVTMHISKGQKVTNMKEQSSISKTSVLFVSISFIVLMIISLAWLVFYYIQRFRYAHAKERLSRRLASAAKKAISKIPQRTVRTGDKELDSDYDQCAVCIEGYKNSDVIRILPCKHVYHKSCVDPWLMDQRSCPMCKMDILRAYGMQINIHCSQESMVPADPESGTVSGMMDEVEPSSSPDEMGAVGGVKIVHFTHPSIQYHPRSRCPEGGATSELPCSSASSPEDTTQAASTSACEDSGHLSDCECNELQSLMKTSSRKGSGSSKDSSSLAGESHS